MGNYNMGRKGKPRSIKWLRIVAALLILALTAGGFTARFIYTRNLQPASASQRNVLVTIPGGSSVKEIAQKLHELGIIKAAWAFEWYVRNSGTGDYLQAGTYHLRANQSIPEIVNVLTNGEIVKGLVTLREGLRLDQVRAVLIKKAGYDEAAVDKALNADLYQGSAALAGKPPFANLEGFIYPNSYEKTANTKPEDIIKAALAEMERYLTPEYKEAIEAHNLTVYEAITLASIVIQEAGSTEDMPTIAQVFLSRLKQDMPLESDPTIIYGALKAGQPASLTYESEYNTYTHKGLPPGPISNVTKDALQAVANPADTDYLYFVAGDDGVTHFSRTLQEHEQNVEKYCKKCAI